MRHRDQDLLFSEGGLDDSNQALAAGDEAEVGTNLVYGAIHQFGGAEGG
jgi:phage gpG-like protein